LDPEAKVVVAVVQRATVTGRLPILLRVESSALILPINASGEKNQRADGAEQAGGHVFLRCPGIALGAEERFGRGCRR